MLKEWRRAEWVDRKPCPFLLQVPGWLLEGRSEWTGRLGKEGAEEHERKTEEQVRRANQLG